MKSPARESGTFCVLDKQLNGSDTYLHNNVRASNLINELS